MIIFSSRSFSLKKRRVCMSSDKSKGKIVF
ncbi:CaiF/GrlA family transcriptional regulator, partial [Salmonella enterica]|nr:CaiF/GrlA family transcriptional regulator [Salmonella enterica]